MNSRPFVIAIVLTLLSAIPLYFLGSGGFQITTANLPILALSLFILLLIAAYWAATAKHKDIVEHTGIELTANNKPAGDESRETGNVKWFNANKGFGFITRDSGDDVFVHFRSIRGSGRRVLRDGQRVEFAVIESDKGLQAEDVAVAS